MKKFWQSVLHGATWLAVYAAEHPDQVKTAVDIIVAAKK